MTNRSPQRRLVPLVVRWFSVWIVGRPPTLFTAAGWALLSALWWLQTDESVLLAAVLVVCKDTVGVGGAGQTGADPQSELAVWLLW